MKNIKNIIYFLPAEKFPSGGAKVIYQHSNLINKMKIKGLSSSILHYKKKRSAKFINSLKKNFYLKKHKKNYFGYNFKDFRIKENFYPDKNWLNTPISFKNDYYFNPKSDFLIFPEIVAHFAKDICFKERINYSIFIQGVYHMYQINNLKKLSNIYRKAKFLIVTTGNSKKLFLHIFPHIKTKILIVNLSIDQKNFNSIGKKTNTITCMPRKLDNHFKLLKFFIHNQLPNKWKIVSLSNLSNDEIYKKLNSSKIFLSFSNLEGLGLPPLEAALSGNKVIGYTGEGGKEYFKKPLFEEVMNGDIYNFSKKIIKNIENFKNLDWSKKKKVVQSRLKLSKEYSITNEVRSLKNIVSFILSLP